MRIARLGFYSMVALLLIGCCIPLANSQMDVNVVATPTAIASSQANEGVTSNCPVTQPQQPMFAAPPPNQATAPWANEFWYGTESLWTALPKSGVWNGLPHNPEGYTQKVFWWRKGYSWTEEPKPALTVTGQRIDMPAPPLNVSTATNAFAEDIQSAMLVGVDFPTLGCWKITGRYADAELSFVVWVAP